MSLTKTTYGPCEQAKLASGEMGRRLLQHRQVLCKKMKPLETLDYLIANGVFSIDLSTRINEERVPNRQNCLLLSQVESKDEAGCRSLCEALKHTGQDELADLLCKDCQESPSCQALEEASGRRLCKHWEQLRKQLVLKPVLDELACMFPPCEETCHGICDDETKISNDRNREFLRLVKNKGVKGYKAFIVALNKTAQGHLAELLADGLFPELLQEPESQAAKAGQEDEQDKTSKSVC